MKRLRNKLKVVLVIVITAIMVEGCGKVITMSCILKNLKAGDIISYMSAGTLLLWY